MNWEGRERRKFKRGEVPFKVFIYVPRERIISTYTLDISQTGMQVIIDEKLKQGSIVDVELYSEEEPLLCKARVVWVEETKDPSRKNTCLYRTGFEFQKA